MTASETLNHAGKWVVAGFSFALGVALFCILWGAIVGSPPWP